MQLYHSSQYVYMSLWRRQGKLNLFLLGSQERHGILEFIILLHYHYHRLPEVDLPQVLTVSGLIPAVHLRTFHLCDFGLFRSVGSYSVLCVGVG
jgi:hypothetical protein